MEQLSGIDSIFLSIETATTFGHVSSLAIFDPPQSNQAATIDVVTTRLEERLHLFPLSRRRLVEVPFGIDHPYWIEDPGFDLEYHVRQIGVPAPGGARELSALVEQIIARPLDRSRPLWEFYLIDGLANGQVAHLSKVHHCAIDGVSGAAVMQTLLDGSAEPTVIDPPDIAWSSEAMPTELEMLGRAMVSIATVPARGAELWSKTIRTISEIANAVGLDSDTIGLDSATTPPRTPFNGVIGPHRGLGFTSIQLDRVRAMKSAFGVTVNDIVMALCAAALRSYLAARDVVPPEPLIAMVPISIRTDDHVVEPGNRIGAMTTSLHSDLDDPVERLYAIHESMRVAKNTHRALPASLLNDLAQFWPPAIAAPIVRLLLQAAAREILDLPCNVVISNIAGPQFPLYSSGAELAACYPVSFIADGVGLNITVQSYDGKLDFGIVGCRDLVPDICDIAEHLHAALDELETIVRASPPTH